MVAELRRTNPRDEAAAWLAASRALLLDDRAGYERERDAPAGRPAPPTATSSPTRPRRWCATAATRTRARWPPTAWRWTAQNAARAGLAGADRCCAWATRARAWRRSRRAWERDPYDARTFNLLDLFEKVIPARYVTVETAHLRFRVEPTARAAIETVVGPFLEEVYQRATSHATAFTPAGPVDVRAVRRSGPLRHPHRRAAAAGRDGGLLRAGDHLAGAHQRRLQLGDGAGARAGPRLRAAAVALARPALVHRGAVGAGDRAAAARVAPARRAVAVGGPAPGRLPPLEKLSQSFVRARDAEAASTAYMHAAVAVEFLERRFGFPKIREALVAFGRGERGARRCSSGCARQPPRRWTKAFRDDLGGAAGRAARPVPARAPARFRSPSAGARRRRPARAGRGGPGRALRGRPPGARATWRARWRDRGAARSRPVPSWPPSWPSGRPRRDAGRRAAGSSSTAGTTATTCGCAWPWRRSGATTRPRTERTCAGRPRWRRPRWSRRRC